MQTQEIKEVYNEIIPNQYKGDYEYNRWFSSPIQKSGYDMTKKSIEQHIIKEKNLTVDRLLELGPGAGTWTKLLRKKFINTKFDLVDISKEMLNLSKKTLGEDNIEYFEIDFLEYSSDKKYDFFFSSRVIEYFPDKKFLFDNIYNLLADKASGFIITKTPKYARYKILGRQVPAMHRTQISPGDLVTLMKTRGFKDIELYPVTMVFPRSILISKIMYRLFYSIKLNFFSQFFAESYCVKFKK